MSKQGEEENQTTYMPSVSYGNETLEFNDTPLNVSATGPYKCKHCDDEITINQIEESLSEEKCLTSGQINLINKILPYLNKYRADYKLDTCLRKAHFIAQIGAEMSFYTGNMIEGTNYSHSALEGYWSYIYKISEISDTMLEALETHLTEIFEIRDKDDKKIEKTNAQIRTIIKNELIGYAGISNSFKVSQLYGRRNISEEVLKTIMKKEEGKDTETVDYKIVILKRNKSFGIETLSRTYSTLHKDNQGNGDELSRDGYRFRGKGLKQITWKGNYKAFSNYRRDNPFPDDPEGYIDFTTVTDTANHKGNFDKLADTNNVIYAVQSALWYYQFGNYKTDNGKKKYTVDWADEDNIKFASKTLNGGWNGLEKRRDYTLLAKKAFKVYEHYELTHENGTLAERKNTEDQLLEISKDINVKVGTKKYNLKDEQAGKLLKKLRTVEPIEIKPMGLNTIPFKIDTPELKLLPVEPIILEDSKKKKKRR